jgi:hypothetical protein
MVDLMRIQNALATALLVLVSVPVSAQQTLTDASATANRAVHEWPMSANTGTPAPRTLTAAELADLDKSKFAKVYATSVAMQASGYATARTPLARQVMLDFKTEAFIAVEKATTKAERALAGKYVEAQWKYELNLDPGFSHEHWKTAFTDALKTLEAANAIYLAKSSK